jgi:hypothetical protein
VQWVTMSNKKNQLDCTIVSYVPGIDLTHVTNYDGSRKEVFLSFGLHDLEGFTIEQVQETIRGEMDKAYYDYLA